MTVVNFRPSEEYPIFFQFENNFLIDHHELLFLARNFIFGFYNPILPLLYHDDLFFTELKCPGHILFDEKALCLRKN